jgi:hypothetical protein
MRITLPPAFPKVAPVLQVFPPVQHKLVEPQNFTIFSSAHENLSRWAVHASLGKTVYEIITKFMQEPPVILPPASAGPATTTTAPSPSPHFNPPPPYSSSPPVMQPKDALKTHTPLPAIPSSFPELEAKSTSELSQLLNDDNEFKKFFESLSCVQTMKKVRDDLRNANEDISKKTLAKEAEIELLRKELATRHHLVNERRSSFEQKAQRQQDVMKRFSTPALIEQLTEAAAQAEAASDDIANKFLSGQMDQKDFLRDFAEKRKLYHLRAAKKESLMMLTR